MEKRYTIFMIDDDPEDQFFFSLAVERANGTVDCIFANNGLQGLDKLSGDDSFTPDCIVMDINMPLMNGMECLQELRKINRLDHVPIYMYSTSGDPRVIKDCLNLGATGVMQKMSSIDSISEFINNLTSGQKITSVLQLRGYR